VILGFTLEEKQRQQVSNYTAEYGRLHVEPLLEEGRAFELGRLPKVPEVTTQAFGAYGSHITAPSWQPLRSEPREYGWISYDRFGIPHVP
jgi:hypothetical protein